MSQTQLQKIGGKLRKKLVQNHPDGLISFPWVLFGSCNDKLHRHAEIAHMFRARFSIFAGCAMWVLQIWYCLRWLFCDAWFSIYLAMNEYADHCDMARKAQFWHLLKYTFWYAIPASDIYENGLMKPNAPILDYVFSTEVQGYHWLHNRVHYQAQNARDLLADKTRFGDEMANLGIPVPKTFLIENAEQMSFAEIFPKSIDKVFVKLRGANAGLAAFSADRVENGFIGQDYQGKKLPSTQDVNHAWHNIAMLGDVIIQPLLQSSVKLAPLSNTDTAITIRVVTKFQNAAPKPVAARLEVPVWDLKMKDQISYVLFPINVETSALEQSPKRGIYGDAFDDLIDETFAKCPATLPHWNDIATHSTNAHAQKFDLYAIAWDWVITDDGPILLEGNSGFGLDTQQMQNGGLLAR